MSLVLVSTGCKNSSSSAEDTAVVQPEKAASSGSARPLGIVSPRTVEAVRTNCDKLCAVMGKCVLKEGKCLAESDDMCQTAMGCQLMGACYARNGSCVPLSDADCEKSYGCESRGACILVDGRCSNSSTMPAASGAASSEAAPARNAPKAGTPKDQTN